MTVSLLLVYALQAPTNQLDTCEIKGTFKRKRKINNKKARKNVRKYLKAGKKIKYITKKCCKLTLQEEFLT